MNLFNRAVWILIAVNVSVFIFAYIAKVNFYEYFALYFPVNPKFGFWQFITHLFLHAGILHLLFNMYALWVFGTPLEPILGKKRFFILYFVCGIGGGIIYILMNNYQFNSIFEQLIAAGISEADLHAILARGFISTELLNLISKAQSKTLYSIYLGSAVGASGAVYGVVTAFAIIYPNEKLILIFLPITMSAKYFFPIIVGIDLFFGLTKYSVGNIAHFAHVGGALFGLLMMVWWFRSSRKKHN